MNIEYYETILNTLKACQEDNLVGKVYEKPMEEFKEGDVPSFTYTKGFFEDNTDKVLEHEAQCAARRLRINLLKQIDYTNAINITWAEFTIKSNNNYWMTDLYTDNNGNYLMIEDKLQELEQLPNVLIDGRMYFDSGKLNKSIPDNTIIELLDGNHVITDFYGYQFTSNCNNDYLEFLAYTYLKDVEKVQVYTLSV